jgi:hypothetical protein
MREGALPGIAERRGFGAISTRQCGRRERTGYQKPSSKGTTNMSNVISFLEQAGRDASMRHASREQLLSAMRKENIEPALQDALLKQSAALPGLLGAREVMFAPNSKTPKPAAKKSAKKPAKKAPAKRK